jgi:RNA-directed DNA polymerase
VDKVLLKTPAARGRMVDHLAHYQLWRAKPARRVYIAKANGKLRPRGIPVMIDRCVQAMVKNTLEPSWEARFEGCSYGFRPGRGCHDAIEKIYKLARPHSRRKWIVDADIKGALQYMNMRLGIKKQGYHCCSRSERTIQMKNTLSVFETFCVTMSETAKKNS